MNGQKFVEISKSFFVEAGYKTAFVKSGLNSIDAVFSFNLGRNLTKHNLGTHRSRIEFELGSPPLTVFLKRYDNPPIPSQLKNWLCHRSRKSCAFFECEAADKLTALDINVPKVIACGEQWDGFFEGRSFVITEKIPDAESLERKLPPYFDLPPTSENLKLRRSFIARLSAFIKKFHHAGYRHRDLYFSHIFYSTSGEFYLIDLARVFKPTLLAERYRVKDIAQLYYSAPAKYFSRTDRLRFYLNYAGRGKLTQKDKTFVGSVLIKVKQITRHDTRSGRTVPIV